MAADTLHTPRPHTGPAPGTPGISLHGLTLAYGRRVLLRDADAPVMLETPSENHAEEIAWLREQLG